MDLHKAATTQLSNIVSKTGKSLDELATILTNTGLQKHTEKLQWAKEHLLLGHGDANALVLYVSKLPTTGTSHADLVEQIFSGQKVSLKPIYQAVIQEIQKWGAFEEHPKKGYIALRRKKQFATIGPTTNTRIDIGINSKTLSGGPRLVSQPTGSMCQFKVSLTALQEVDTELFDWLQTAFTESE